MTDVRRTHKKVHHLTGLLLGLYTGAVATYVTAEHRSMSDAMWWAFMTFTTVGYGDQYPHSIAGRLAGVVLVSTAMFLVLPVITAAIISRFEDDGNKWTHDEQEEVKGALRELLARERARDFDKVN
jgi:voltage-gated potassium channel